MGKFRGKCFCGNEIAIKHPDGRLLLTAEYRNMYLVLHNIECCVDHEGCEENKTREMRIRIPVCRECFENPNFDYAKAEKYWKDENSFKPYLDSGFEAVKSEQYKG